MQSETAKELQQFKQLAEGLEVQISSEDTTVAIKADAQLAQLNKDIEAWAKKNKVRSFQHTVAETGSAETRRRCKPMIILPPSTNPDASANVCLLMGKQGRNCLYVCYITE